jgi:hypothetical protein
MFGGAVLVLVGAGWYATDGFGGMVRDGPVKQGQGPDAPGGPSHA